MNLFEYWRELQSRQVRRTDRIADVVFACMLGVLGAMLLVHWLAA
jgi:hypothetical protein